MFMIIKEIMAREYACTMALTTFRINKAIRKTPIRKKKVEGEGTKPEYIRKQRKTRRNVAKKAGML